MSHLVTGEVKIKATEIDALRRAVEHLGAHVEDRNIFRWYRGHEKCDAVITTNVEGKFEVGLRLGHDGNFETVYDSYGAGGWIPQMFGDRLTKLQDRFLAEVTSDEFAAQGLSVEITETDDGLVIDGLSYAEEG